MNNDRNHTSTLLVQATPEAMAVMRRFNEQSTQGLGAVRRDFKQPQSTGLEAVGIKGERGLNLTGAMTQVLQKSASANSPEQAKAKMQYGLVNSTSAQYVEALKNFDIDVEKFAPDGKFRGEGGVEGLLELVDVMKAKGLEDNLKTGQAGFNNRETNQLIQALMENSDIIRSEVASADQTAKSKRLSTDFAEAKQADFGKIKAAEIQVDKLTSSDSSDKITANASNSPGKSADDTAPTGGLGLEMGVIGGLTTALAGVSLYKNRRKKSGGKTGRFANVAGSMDVQSVFVTNWPSGMLSKGEPLRQKRNEKNREAAMRGGNGKPSKGGRTLGLINKVRSLDYLKESFSFGRDVVGPVVRDGIDSLVSAVSGEETKLGFYLHDLINGKQEPTKVVVEVQNGNIVASVDQAHTRNAARQ